MNVFRRKKVQILSAIDITAQTGFRLLDDVEA
jgi:hypothetical protein